MFTSSELALLLKKHIEGTLLPHEQQQLENWMAQDTLHREFVTHILQDESILTDYEDWLAARKLLEEFGMDRIKNNTFERIHKEQQQTNEIPIVPIKYKRMNWFRALVSTAAAVCMITMIWLGYDKLSTPDIQSTTAGIIDLGPAVNKTTLTLSNGEQVELRSDQQGILLDSGINYTDGSAVVAVDTEELSKLHATITVPKGSMYRIALSDGSQVVLNAMSSLTYPLAFATDSREVSLSGEGYFEIAKQMKDGERVPFIVHTAEQQVSVTGTQFNIRAYADEKNTVSTLVEGSITVSKDQKQIYLQPNEQTTVTGTTIEKKVVDAQAYIAWTKDKFLFNETELALVLQTISRWYDVQIHDNNTRSEMYFYGEIARQKNLSEVLHLLEKSGVQFKLERQNQQHHLYVNNKPANIAK